MKHKLLPFALVLSALFPFAALAISQAENAELQHMSHQAAMLQAQLDALQADIRELKHQKKTSKQTVKKTVNRRPHPVYVEQPIAEPVVVPVPVNYVERHHPGETERYNRVVEEHPTPVEGQVDYIYYPHTVFRYGGIAVITSPYIGIRSEFDGADLIVNISSINEDLRLLQQMQTITKVLEEHGAPPLTHPLIELSGKVEALTYVNDPFVGSTHADIDLGSVELATTAYLNSWALGFMAFDFDGTPPVISGKRVDNSRLYLNKGFLSIGNLNIYPVYTTWGQYYVPFGRYSSNMLSAPLPLAMARTKSRAILLGYKQPGETGFFAETYVFDADAHPDHSSWQGGFNVGYTFRTQDVGGEVAFGIIADLADSDGMQITGGGSGFGGFAANIPAGTEALDKRVPAADLNIKFGYKSWSFIAEYVSALTTFSPNDLQFNGEGALPSAFNMEAAYQFIALNRPMSVALGYGFTTDAFALNLPSQRVIGALNVSFLRNTIETLEIRHDWAYCGDTTGAGRTSFDTTTPVNTASVGKELTIATLQVGVYF